MLNTKTRKFVQTLSAEDRELLDGIILDGLMGACFEEKDIKAWTPEDVKGILCSY